MSPAKESGCWLTSSARGSPRISAKACSARRCTWPTAVGAFVKFAAPRRCWHYWPLSAFWSGINSLQAGVPLPYRLDLTTSSVRNRCPQWRGWKQDHSLLPASSHPRGLATSSSLLRLAPRFVLLPMKNFWPRYRNLPPWSASARIRQNWSSSTRWTGKSYWETEFKACCRGAPSTIWTLSESPGASWESRRTLAGHSP